MNSAKAAFVKRITIYHTSDSSSSEVLSLNRYNISIQKEKHL